MDQKNNENQMEEQDPIISEPAPEERSSETIQMEESSPPESIEEEPKLIGEKESEDVPVKKQTEDEPSKTQKFFQKALVWLIVVVIAFGSGFLLDHFLRYIPLKQDLSEVRSEMQTLNEDLDELNGQIEQLRPKLEAANARISSLENDLEMANARTLLYQVLASVNNARLDIFQEEFEAAQVDLVQTSEYLEELAPVIEEIDPELALSLLRRLELITDGLERDPETASIDLELFTKDLLALETLLFEE